MQEQVLEPVGKNFTWFDRLTTNGKMFTDNGKILLAYSAHPELVEG